MEKYVITGGPCTGKTTMIDAVEVRGYSVVREAARQIILEEQEKERAQQKAVLPWTDFAGFQKLVIHRQIALEERVGSAAFCDRSGVDGIAYCWLGGVSVPDEVAAYAKQATFGAVFLLDRLPYKQDAERREDAATADKIHGLIAQAYVEQGHRLIRVPVLPIEERVDYIIRMIK